MNCPNCQMLLEPYEHDGLTVNTCRHCGGIWFDEGELRDYLEDLLHEKQDIPYSPIQMNPPKALGENDLKPTNKLCPRCNQPLHPFNYCYDSNIILGKCPVCSGIWVDGGEIEKLAQYQKINPHMDGIGEGLARQVQYHDKIKQLASSWRTYRGYNF